MPDLAIDFTVRPSTVAAAVYGVMTIVAEHTSSLARLDDLRIALDELFYELPQDQDVRVALTVHVGEDRSRVNFHAGVPRLDVHATVAALVDEFALTSDAEGITARLDVRHD